MESREKKGIKDQNNAVIACFRRLGVPLPHITYCTFLVH